MQAQSARGDSQVALSGAVSAIAGCLSIVQLNLLPFGSNEYTWIQQTKQQCDDLRKQYENLNQIASLKMDVLSRKVEAKTLFYQQVDELLTLTKSHERLTNGELERFATDLQNLVWRNRRSIWGEDTDVTFMNIIEPSTIFNKVLGYKYDDKHDLGDYYADGKLMDVAGLIDQGNRMVRISNHTSTQTRNFTAAHELGHALLHKQTVLNRDIPVDRLTEAKDRPIEESQADRFASFFLMPRKLIQRRFKELFFTDEYNINSETTFRLTGSSATDLRKECRNIEELCVKLASTESYGGEFFRSIADEFKVSVKAMAIRLEQLGLVRY